MLLRPITDEVVKKAIFAVGHFTEDDDDVDFYVNISDWDKDTLYLKITFKRWSEVKEYREKHPEKHLFHSFLRHWYIVAVPIDEELAIDTTSE
jgi:hypothetical protein